MVADAADDRRRIAGEECERRRHELRSENRHDAHGDRGGEHGAGDPPHLLRMRRRDAHAGEAHIEAAREERDKAEQDVESRNPCKDRQDHAQPRRNPPSPFWLRRTGYPGCDRERDDVVEDVLLDPQSDAERGGGDQYVARPFQGRGQRLTPSPLIDSEQQHRAHQHRPHDFRAAAQRPQHERRRSDDEERGRRPRDAAREHALEQPEIQAEKHDEAGERDGLERDDARSGGAKDSACEEDLRRAFVPLAPEEERAFAGTA